VAKSKKLDIKRYLSETEKDAALQEYILNHPELVEKSIKEFIHETVQYTCRDISYNSTLAANKKYAEFKNKFFAVVETELEKILAAPDLFDSLLGDINYRELLTKELKDIFRHQAIRYHRLFSVVLLTQYLLVLLPSWKQIQLLRNLTMKLRLHLEHVSQRQQSKQKSIDLWVEGNEM
jgi:hypothetical protein